MIGTYLPMFLMIAVAVTLAVLFFTGATYLGGKLNKGAFASPVKDFYLTNPIARASAVMAECSALAKNGFKQAAE